MDARQLWARRLAIATAIAFVISSVFPIGAGLATNTAAFPRWWGVADVVLAFILALLAAALGGLIGRGVSKAAEASTYRSYRLLTHGILALLVVFFLAGDRINWINCLTGFAWRAWLLLYTLPAWFTAMADRLTLSVRSTESR